MATAAEAATEAASAPAEGGEAAPEVTGQDGLESPTGDAPAEGAAAAKPKVVSETVRLVREKRALERKLAELTAAKPASAEKPLTRESIVAELKAEYEDDPESFLEKVAGDDFIKLAARVAKREETAKAPGTKIEALEKELRDLKAKYEGDTKSKADADTQAKVQAHIAVVSKEVEAKDADGEYKYPTLATLDPSVAEEPPAVTVYKAVEIAFGKECMKDGKIVKRWTNEEQADRFHRAFKAVDAHYAKIRTPTTPNTPRAEEPEPSPTISKSTSSGTADTPVRRRSGTLSVQEALREALKEHGLDR